MKPLALALLLLLLPGCAIKRRWVASEAAYDRWMEKATMQCVRDKMDLGGLSLKDAKQACNPNWHSCPNGSNQASCQ